MLNFKKGHTLNQYIKIYKIYNLFKSFKKKRTCLRYISIKITPLNI